MIPKLTIDQVCLFLDVDGTLIDIAARPDEVVVPEMLIRTLDRLDRRLDGAVALVSGRSIADLDGLFRPLRLRASGVHGAEMRVHPEHDVVAQGAIALPSSTVASIISLASAYPGTLVEDKRYSVAVHYREAAASGPALHGVLRHFTATDQGKGLSILRGHMVFEIKSTSFDKGMAIGNFLERPPFKGRLPVFLGDDVTDLPGFETVLEANGYAFCVGEARTGLSGYFPDPAAVRQWLAGLVVVEARNA